MAFEHLPPIYKLAELAERWGCSHAHVRKLVEDGRLRAFRIGKLWRVRGDAVDEFETQAAVPKPGPDAPAGPDGVVQSGRKRSVAPAAGQGLSAEAAYAASRLKDVMARERARNRRK